MHEAPSLNEIQSFLNHTRKFNVNECYTSITDQSEHYRNIRVRIQELAKKIEQNENKDKSTPLYNDLTHMRDECLKFFTSLGGTYYSDIMNGVLKNPMIVKNITMSKDENSTGSVKIDSDNKIIITASITPDAKGMMTLCQVLSDAHVLTHSVNQENKRDELEENLVEKKTNMFISTCLINYIAKDSRLTENEIDVLQYDALKSLEYETQSLETDREIFQMILDAYPEAFATNLENFTPENFLNSMDKAFDNMEREDVEKINNRIREIAEKGNTARYIQGEVAADIAGMEKAGDFINHPIATDKTKENLLDSIEMTHEEENINGKDVRDIKEGDGIESKKDEDEMEDGQFVMTRN